MDDGQMPLISDHHRLDLRPIASNCWKKCNLYIHTCVHRFLYAYNHMNINLYILYIYFIIFHIPPVDFSTFSLFQPNWFPSVPPRTVVVKEAASTWLEMAMAATSAAVHAAKVWSVHLLPRSRAWKREPLRKVPWHVASLKSPWVKRQMGGFFKTLFPRKKPLPTKKLAWICEHDLFVYLDLPVWGTNGSVTGCQITIWHPGGSVVRWLARVWEKYRFFHLPRSLCFKKCIWVRKMLLLLFLLQYFYYVSFQVLSSINLDTILSS